ncbi:MAG: lactate utilization protein [Candidatus Dadabacteria bacterium]|nr:lactate utilization protein [Candidatus Dadabacteria bacterium]
MSREAKDVILASIRRGLKRFEKGRGESPAPPPTWNAGSLKHSYDEDSLTREFVEEVIKVKGHAEVTDSGEEILSFALGLFEEYGTNSCAMADGDFLESLSLAEHLESKGIGVVRPGSGDSVVADAGIGITEADYAISDSGTLVLLTNENNPRSFSLLPPVHLAIVKRSAIVHNIYDVMEELNSSVVKYEHPDQFPSCITFITGPSRTADIELNLTLGVHGPKALYVLVYGDKG